MMLWIAQPRQRAQLSFMTSVRVSVMSFFLEGEDSGMSSGTMWNKRGIRVAKHSTHLAMWQYDSSTPGVKFD